MTANLLVLTKEKRELPMKRHLMLATALAAVLGMVLFSPTFAFSQDQCSTALPITNPFNHLPVTGCGALITVGAVNGAGKAVFFTVTTPNNGNNNPFDGIEDTLIGIQNNSGAPLNSITLSSSDIAEGGIFNFDGDGVCTFNESDCNGPTGYEGPDNTFINISTTQCGDFTCHTSGTINFTTAIPNGGGTWFALEGKPDSLLFFKGNQTDITGGGTVNLTPDGAPVNQNVAFPTGTGFGNVMFMQLTETPVDPTLFNSTRFTNIPKNTFSGGSDVPSTVQCLPINGSCFSLLFQCFDSSGTELTNHCLDIVPPSGKLLNLTSQFQTPTGIKNPALLIASDFQNDWANITNFFDPGDPCTTPPCSGGGGTKSFNSESVLADLNLGCQVLTYTLSPTSASPGQSIKVTGNLKGCTFVSGEKTLFGALLASLTFRLTGPLRSNGVCTPQTVVAPALPLLLPFNSNIPFKFPVKIPTNACTGTSVVTSSIISGTVEYVWSATLAVP